MLLGFAVEVKDFPGFPDQHDAEPQGIEDAKKATRRGVWRRIGSQMLHRANRKSRQGSAESTHKAALLSQLGDEKPGCFD